VPSPTDHGRQWRTPEELIPHARANHRAALWRYGPSPDGAIGWSGAGPERWFTGVSQILVIGWPFSSRFESKAPPTETRRRRHGTVTAFWTSPWCPPGEWGPKLGLRHSSPSPLQLPRQPEAALSLITNWVSGVQGSTLRGIVGWRDKQVHHGTRMQIGYETVHEKMGN